VQHRGGSKGGSRELPQSDVWLSLPSTKKGGVLEPPRVQETPSHLNAAAYPPNRNVPVHLTAYLYEACTDYVVTRRFTGALFDRWRRALLGRKKVSAARRQRRSDDEALTVDL